MCFLHPEADGHAGMEVNNEGGKGVATYFKSAGKKHQTRILYLAKISFKNKSQKK